MLFEGEQPIVLGIYFSIIGLNFKNIQVCFNSIVVFLYKVVKYASPIYCIVSTLLIITIFIHLFGVYLLNWLSN